MLVAPEPFPWWLWLLAALWAATLLVWQRAPLPRDWQWGMGLVVVVYTGLLTAVALPEFSAWTVSRGLFWLSGGLAIGGGLLIVRQTTITIERLGMGIVCLGIAGLLAQLGSVVVAGLTLLLGVFVAGGSLRRASRRQPDVLEINDSATFGVANRDAWLIGVTAVLVLVAWFGSVRYALTVESNRPGPSQWFTALPSRDRVRTWLITEPGHTTAAPPGPDVHWELLGLGAIWVWAVSRARGVPAVNPQSTIRNPQSHGG